jgi:DAK2 domain fusion protein YloV
MTGKGAKSMKANISGSEFALMFASGAAGIDNNQQLVNELNVFPVPDGDTGVNMSLTMDSGLAELTKGATEHCGKAAGLAASGLLRGARGNSGVILSLLFRGFAKTVVDKERIDGADFALALTAGVESAYRAVMKPAEGTILTVTRVAAARGKDAALQDPSVEHVLKEIVLAAQIALEETIEQNPVLKKAGVIDSGGKGICIILEGMLSALRGQSVVRARHTAEVSQDKADFSIFDAEEILYAYCTEFIILKNGNSKNPHKLQTFLESLGDSLVFVDDDELIKVHVHTNNPGKAVEEALKYGALTKIKIENMKEQHTQVVIHQEVPVASAEPEEIQKYGLVSVCAGQGIIDVMMNLGVSKVVEGGQTMNPSTDDILSVINSVPAETVFVLPNNKNIIMAAQQAVPLANKTVKVLPSATIPQGISALLAFDSKLEPEENEEAMNLALGTVITCSVTYAARDSQYDGREIKEGDHMALVEGKLVAVSKTLVETMQTLIEELVQYHPTYVSMFYGEDLSEQETDEFAEMLKKQLPSADVTVLAGGQPVYSLLISVE